MLLFIEINYRRILPKGCIESILFYLFLYLGVINDCNYFPFKDIDRTWINS